MPCPMHSPSEEECDAASSRQSRSKDEKKTFSNSLINLMFGGRAEVESANRNEHDIRLARAITQWPAHHEQYFRNYIDQLRDNVLRLFCIGCLTTPTWIKNNNAEPQHALVGIGEHVLAPSHAHVLISPEQWDKLSKQQKQKLRMLMLPARRACTVTSSDNTLTVNSTPGKSKKPCQRKRKRSDKTTTWVSKRLGQQEQKAKI
ncbi:hypothetical protein RRG08_030086 [Elysia crispata]|uniref:Uncharacterized protein n=1 Tax=Elysia crispata TaxID=231223 RepID=A0AAE0ZR53_9GAST|nr:hypothetical protein RRG08_030086 [Elysia crispata]